MDEQKITTYEFVRYLLEEAKLEKSFADDDAMWLYGRQKGWLEEQDQLWQERPIEKRNAARIAHEFLRIEFQEADARDWSSAKVLEDLYHCRVCAKHVAQVYIKGIIFSRTEKRFGLLDMITYDEMVQIVERMFHKEKRIKDEI